MDGHGPAALRSVLAASHEGGRGMNVIHGSMIVRFRLLMGTVRLDGVVRLGPNQVVCVGESISSLAVLPVEPVLVTAFVLE